MLGVDEVSFLTIVAVAALASLLVALLDQRLALPVVVVELLLGILVGPDVLDLAKPDDFTDFFANLGLGLLFFFAGYEIDFTRIRGRPLALAAAAWTLSLVIAYSLAAGLMATGVILSMLFVGSATATTAIGTLIPILSDRGELRTPFGAYLLAAGAVGEFGPIMLITLVLSTRNPLSTGVILIAFVAIAVLAAVFAVRTMPRGWPVLERTLDTSGQLPVRLYVLLVFALVALASSLGLDLLLGGFVAGIIARLALSGREVERFDAKLTAVGYGFFIPFFFVVSGAEFNLDALLESSSALLKVPLFFVVFLVVRGLPALVLYRGALDLRDRQALAAFSATQLPLVVAITTIAVEEGHMRSSTAASLVGAAILSTLVFPLLGLRLRGDRAGLEEPPLAPAA